MGTQRLTLKVNVSVSRKFRREAKLGASEMSGSSETNEGYDGPIDDEGQPHGKGQFRFKDDDAFDRKFYEGEWLHGQMSGQGQMSFVSGDIYEGVFNNGVPHGPGRFTYASGDVETADFENGLRHGLSRYVSTSGNNVEEAMFWEGIPEGPATLRSASGTVEEFHYNQGVREGSAIRKIHTGDTLEFKYIDGEINGPAKLTRP